MKITIYGAGYVGLVTGACLAEIGNDVMIVEINQDRLATLKQSEVPIYEPGLENLFKRNLAAGRLQFTDDAKQGVGHGLLQFIAVGTPPAADGSADLRYVFTVAETIGQYINDYRVIINKSTVSVGTADRVAAIVKQGLAQRQVNIDFDVVSNPEFLKEGAAIDDFMHPDRIIIGAQSEKALQLMQALYAPLNSQGDRLFAMGVRSAELTKYAANALLATKISFMNEIASIAERVGADIESVRQGIGSDPRIGPHFIYPGCGYGGSCFPKDVRALLNTGREFDYEAQILDAVENVNNRQKRVLFDKLHHYYASDLRHKVFAVWGLAFKPNTDDVREASSRVLMESLWQQGARVQAYDPVAMNEIAHIYGQRDDLVLCESAEQALEGADALVIVTEWPQFRAPDFAVIKKQLKAAVIFDGRNLFEPKQLSELGFEYYGIGRGQNRFASNRFGTSRLLNKAKQGEGVTQ